MSFQAVLRSPEARQSWCKIVSSLAGVSDTFRFVITGSRLAVSALNTSRTANVDVFLKRQFFDSFQFLADVDDDEAEAAGQGREGSGEEEINMESLIEEGFTVSGGGAPRRNAVCYSFIIQARFLSVLFKVSPDDDEYTLSINFRKDCPRSHKFRLLVEKISKKKVKKQFSPGFQPCWLSDSDVSRGYKARLSRLWREYSLDDSDSDSEGRKHGDKDLPDQSLPLHYLVLDNAVLKKFLEVTPATIEDFQINVKQSIQRLHFIAFLKPLKKDKVYIRQPMSLCVSISLDDVVDLFLHRGEAHTASESSEQVGNAENPDSIKVTFRLKELRTFISIASALSFIASVNRGNANSRAPNDFRADSHSADTSHINATGSDDYTSNDTFEIFFARHGDPIVLEAYTRRKVVTMRLTQMTDMDENLHAEQQQVVDIATGNVNVEAAKRKRPQLPEYKVIRKVSRKRGASKREFNNRDDNYNKNSDGEGNDKRNPTRAQINNKDGYHDDDNDDEREVAEILARQEESDAENLFVDQDDLASIYNVDETTLATTQRLRSALKLSGKMQHRHANTSKLAEALQEKPVPHGDTDFSGSGNFNDDEDGYDYEHQATITWNSSRVRDDRPETTTRKRVLVESNDIEEKEEEEEEGIGRTQHVKKVRGLFD